MRPDLARYHARAETRVGYPRSALSNKSTAPSTPRRPKPTERSASDWVKLESDTEVPDLHCTAAPGQPRRSRVATHATSNTRAEAHVLPRKVPTAISAEAQAAPPSVAHRRSGRQHRVTTPEGTVGSSTIWPQPAEADPASTQRPKPSEQRTRVTSPERSRGLPESKCLVTGRVETPPHQAVSVLILLRATEVAARGTSSSVPSLPHWTRGSCANCHRARRPVDRGSCLTHLEVRSTLRRARSSRLSTPPSAPPGSVSRVRLDGLRGGAANSRALLR